MSFAEDLWDGFAAVGKWEFQGIAMCKAICRFYRKRAKIEETYGKSLFKLVQQMTEEIQQPGSAYCNDTICHGTLGSGWVATCHNTQVQSELHLNLAEQIRKNIVDNLQTNTIQLEDQLKQVSKEGERLLIDQEQWLSNLKKVKQTYYKTVKEAEAAKSVFDESLESKTFSSKAEKRVIKASQEAQAAEMSYLSQIKHTNQFMSVFNNELMPRVMKRLEDIGRSRQQVILHHFKEMSRISEEIPNGLSSAGNALSKAINQVDVQKDIQDFIKFNKTQNQIPAPFQYEAPAEELSPPMDGGKKGKNFFTLARKINTNIFGSPNSSKGNAGSPPSLSPSTSGVFSREKTFKFTVFGNSLDDIMAGQREVLPDCDVPYFLVVLAVDMLRSNALCLEGIFRVPAPTNEIDALARQFDNGNYDLSSVQSPYTTAHMVKKWCRDLPDPLIPSYLYEKCIACETQEEAREIIPMIPPIYNKVVVFLAQLLHEFSLPNYLEYSKMGSANFAMVFTPSFLRCSSTEMADFLLNVHREKQFVQLLIEGVQERVSLETLEQSLHIDDHVIKRKFQYSTRRVEIPLLQISAISDTPEYRSELQRQASEREMLQVKQQQLKKLTAKDEFTDPKALQARLMDEQAEKERFQDSLSLKDKTIKVMRTELSHTLQEKLKLENAVKELQLRIEKLESHYGDSALPAADAAALAGLVSWSPFRTNVRENIQNYERRTRSFRSGSVDTGVDRLKSSWPLRRSMSPLSPKSQYDDKRNTVHMGDSILGVAPFKLMVKPTDKPTIPTLSPLPTVQEEPKRSSTTRYYTLSPPVSPGKQRETFSDPPASPPRTVASAPASPRRNSNAEDPPSPRRSTLASPRGVSFRDLNTVHVYSDNLEGPASATATPRNDINSPRIPRIKIPGLEESATEAISPRSRHTLGTSSPRSSTSSRELNSPRNPRHSTPATTTADPSSPRLMGISTISYSSSNKRALLDSEELPTSVTRTMSYAGMVKRKSSINSNLSSLPRKEETSSKRSSKSNKNSLTKEDQRTYDLISTMKPTAPASPKSLAQSFPLKLRLLIQKQPKSPDPSSPLALDKFTPAKSFTSLPLPVPGSSSDEPPKSPRSPGTSPRLVSPRNRPHTRKKSTIATTPPDLKFTPISPRGRPPGLSIITVDEVEEELLNIPISPRTQRRTLSFPTPRAHTPPTSLISSTGAIANRPLSPRPTRSQTFTQSPSASPQELLSLALEVDKMKKEVHKRLCGCVEIISNTTDYTQTIEISKSIRLLIKCLDFALSKLGIDERQMRQLGTGKSSSLPQIPVSTEDTRLRKLREILVISLDRIVDQMKCLADTSAQITTQDEMNIITQTISEMQLFFSKQDQAITKLDAQDVFDGIKNKIESLKSCWNELPLERQVDIAKVVIDVKKNVDDFCAEHALEAAVDPTLSTAPHTIADTQSERITKTIFMTLDKISHLSLGILHHLQQHGLQSSTDDSLFTEKLLEVFKSLATK